MYIFFILVAFLFLDVSIFGVLLSRGQFLDCKGERLCRWPNICATNSCEIVGHGRMAKIDRAISMNFSLSSMFKKSTPGESGSQPLFQLKGPQVLPEKGG